MAKHKVVDLKAQPTGEVELSDVVFGQEVNQDLLYEVLKAQLASKRSGSANTRIRAEVRGSSAKIYKQKGTGRARHGAIRAPNFVGGGTVHGPKPRDYSYRPPRKMRLGAMRSALSLKAKEGRLVVVEDFQLPEVKTKNLVGVLSQLKAPKSALIVDKADNEKLRLSARNLPSHQVIPPEGVNLYDLLRHEHLIVTKEAVKELERRFSA